MHADRLDGGQTAHLILQEYDPLTLRIFWGYFLAWPPPAEPRGEKKLFFVQILGGEKLF